MSQDPGENPVKPGRSSGLGFCMNYNKEAKSLTFGRGSEVSQEYPLIKEIYLKL